MDDVVAQLQIIGMTGYEAKAYIALVSAGSPITGYEVAKRSGVPRSTVYETLSKLVARAAAYEVRGLDGATEYLPLPPAALLGRARDDIDDAIEKLRKQLSSVAIEQATHYTHRLADREETLRRCMDLCAAAKRDVLVLGWPEELHDLRRALARAQTGGAAVKILSFGEFVDPVGEVHLHRSGSAESVVELFSGRLLVLIADLEEIIVAGFVDDEAWGILTDDPAVITLGSHFVRFDMSVQLLMTRLEGDPVLAEWLADPALKRINENGTAIAWLRHLRPQPERPRRARR
jgi:sugar-specific transcriptional regulator TrmB